MKNNRLYLSLPRLALFLLVLILSLTVTSPAFASSIPTGPITSPELTRDVQSPLERERAELRSFISTVKDPQRTSIPVAVFAPGVLANPILQQPAGNAVFVSSQAEALTQFRLATAQGSLGLLAHNTLAGERFFDLKPGDTIYVVYGDSHYERYVIYNYNDYQALTPRLFEDLQTGERYSDYEVFYRVYDGNGKKLVLQTCVEKDGNYTWGRRFIFAMRVAEGQPGAGVAIHPN